MGVILEIRSGSAAGKAIALRRGESVTVGRAAGKAEFALAEDTFMSGLHFAVQCSASSCRVVDRKSSNGTFLNGAKIQDAMLANGDEIKAGKTVFHVKIVADEKLASMTMPQQAADAARLSPGPVVEAGGPARPEFAAPYAENGAPSSREADQSTSPRVSEPSSLPAAVPIKTGQAPVAPPAARSNPSGAVAPSAPEPNARPSEDAAPALRRTPEQSPRNARLGSPSATPSAPVADRVGGAQGARHPLPSRPDPSPSSSGAPSGAPANATLTAGPKPVISTPAPAGGKSRIPAFSVMGWSFFVIPERWQVQEDVGLHNETKADFPSSVVVSQEYLRGISLPQFVESQISMLRQYLRDPRIEPSMPPPVAGAEETMAVDVWHSTKDAKELVYRRIYARSGSSVGVLTVTTLASEFPRVIESLEPLLDGAAFRATVHTS